MPISARFLGASLFASLPIHWILSSYAHTTNLLLCVIGKNASGNHSEVLYRESWKQNTALSEPKCMKNGVNQSWFGIHFTLFLSRRQFECVLSPFSDLLAVTSWRTSQCFRTAWQGWYQLTNPDGCTWMARVGPELTISALDVGAHATAGAFSASSLHLHLHTLKM